MFNYGKLLESLVCVLIALVTVYFWAWVLQWQPAEVVGWVALGIAAGATVRD